MRNKISSSTPTRHSHWLVRMVGWLFGKNLAQWLCMSVVMLFSYIIAKGGHGFDLLVFWVAAQLWITFKPNKQLS